MTSSTVTEKPLLRAAQENDASRAKQVLFGKDFRNRNTLSIPFQNVNSLDQSLKTPRKSMVKHSNTTKTKGG